MEINLLKEISNYNNYKIDEDGNIFNEKGNKLFQWIDTCGFKQVVLYKDKKRNYKRINRLVYETFCGKIPSKMVLVAKDGDNSNPSLNNLKLVTNSEKLNLYYKSNTSSRYNIKVYTKENSTFVGEFFSIREMCLSLNLNRRTVNNIIKHNLRNNYKYYFKVIEV